jgi:hypothetical protein
VAVQGRKRNPAPRGESCSANWKNWLVRKAAEKIAAAMKNCAPTADENDARRNRCSGIIGSGARPSHQTNPPSSSTPARSPRTFCALPHPSWPPWTRPQMSTPTPLETNTSAGTSRRARGP